MARLRTLTFDAADEKRFALFYNLFVAGGNQVYRQPQTGLPLARARDERGKEGRIITALEALSLEVDEQTGARRLRPEGGTLTLDQKQHELVMKYLEAAPAGTQDSARVDALLDWVGAAPQTPEEPPA